MLIDDDMPEPYAMPTTIEGQRQLLLDLGIDPRMAQLLADPERATRLEMETRRRDLAQALGVRPASISDADYQLMGV